MPKAKRGRPGSEPPRTIRPRKRGRPPDRPEPRQSTMPASHSTPALPAPRLEFAFSLSVEVGTAVELGGPGESRRRWIPVTGGSFTGPRICGRILPGADWQTVRSQEVIEIDARYALQTDDGAVVSILNTGLRRLGSA